MRRKEVGERKKAVILVSGGMDSCVTASTAIAEAAVTQLSIPPETNMTATFNEK